LWNNLPLTEIHALPSVNPATEFVRVRGEIREIDHSAGRMAISDGIARVVVERIGKLPEDPGGHVEVIGRLNRSPSGVSLQWGVYRELDQKKNSDRQPLPVLTTIEQVHRLKKEQAALHYPVRVQAVVTWAIPGEVDGIVQDATRGIYVSDLAPSPSDTPRIGDYVEISGQSDTGEFAPIITG